MKRWPLGVGVLVALAGLTACVAPSGRGVSREAARAETRAAIEDGVRLYEGGEYAMAGRRFAAGADGAERLGDLPLAFRAVAAECASWLLARQLAELDACSLRLEALQHRTHETDGGTNALVALGAVAGGRAQPAVNVPRPVRTVVRPGLEDVR
jgi:hypothetical protein